MSAASSEPDGDAADDFKSIAEQDDAEMTEAAADRQFIINVARMSVMWTAASFSNYLLLYLNKYLTGTIFNNFYLDAVATFVSMAVSTPLYSSCLTRISFIASFTITLVGTVGILAMESHQ